MMKLSLPGTRDYFAPNHISNGILAETEISIHSIRESIAQNGWDRRRVAIFIDARNDFNEMGCQLILDAVVIHAPGLARYIHMVYDCAPWLIAGRHLIRSL